MDTPNHNEHAASQAEGQGQAGPPALEMIDVSVGSMKFSEQFMLEGVNWTVRSDDFWMVGGLQASGKSDLLATAAGLMQPLRGTYRLFGRELATGFEHERVALRLRIGLVFDGGRLLRHLSVGENILLPLRYHYRPSPTELEETLRILLEFTGMTRHAHSSLETLGLNWQQRVGLARALTLKPEVLLLDNPLTGLDPLHTQWWLTVLDQLAAGHPILGNRPLTLVVTGDDLRPWRNHARQFAVLKEKRFLPVETRPDGSLPEESVLSELLGMEAVKRDE